MSLKTSYYLIVCILMNFEIIFLPKNLWGLTENVGCFRGGELRVSIEEDILNPPNVTVWSNPFTTISVRFRWTGLVLKRLGQGEEADSLLL